MKTSCSFCDLTSQADRLIRSNDLMASFLSNPRLAPGHVLVIPRRHFEPPQALNDAELIAIYQEITRLSTHLLTIFKGVDIWQKTRPQVAENTIKRHHLHFHVIPSNPGDSVYERALEWDPDHFLVLSAGERNQMLKLLK
ncbi:MAG TPA: HIT domain-containing protein [Candidatus Saccharimonadales bacterium]|nr:HIT domain-containing protein [Candidatus Saccharimonadales bacterium]